jgi:hypothetical protein
MGDISKTERPIHSCPTKRKYFLIVEEKNMKILPCFVIKFMDPDP